MGYFLAVLLQREILAHQLFPATRQFVGRDGERALQFLREADRYAAAYEAIEAAASSNPAERASLERIRVADTQTLTPVLMWLFANAPESERLPATLAIESYVIRRLLCRLTSKNYNRLFLELLRRLGEGHGPADQVVIDFLNAQTSESGVWPTDEEVARSLGSLPIYRLLRRERLQGILRALEAHATTSKTENVTITGRLSVEHLLPQSWEANWPIPEGVEIEDVREERDALLHTLGNLTLVTGSLNATMSNSPWTTKRDHLMAHSALTLNRTLPATWDEDAIRARGRFLSRQACDLWRRPAPNEGSDPFADDSERDLTPEPDAKDTRKARPSGRRDIGQHITNAFSDLDSGQFLTVAEIRKRRSDEYGDTPPSAGAIAARLFPPNGHTTVPGVSAETVNGIRGARKA